MRVRRLAQGHHNRSECRRPLTCRSCVYRTNMSFLYWDPFSLIDKALSVEQSDLLYLQFVSLQRRVGGDLRSVCGDGFTCRQGCSNRYAASPSLTRARCGCLNQPLTLHSTLHTLTRRISSQIRNKQGLK